MEPADEVGGDYYDVLQQDGQVKISIGDVTGHGLESGVLRIMAQTAVRTLQKMKETDPVKFLDVVNLTLYDNLQRMDPDKNMSLAILEDVLKVEASKKSCEPSDHDPNHRYVDKSLRCLG